MNFDRLTQTLKVSAAIAAEAAANFQGFDEMAANDDYVQSPEFNVTSGGRRRDRNGDRNAVQQQHFDDESTLSTHSSLRASTFASLYQQNQQTTPPNNSNNNNNYTNTNDNYGNSNAAKATPLEGRGAEATEAPKRQLVPLKVSVPERKMPRQRNQAPGEADDEDDSLSRSSDDEDVNNDPILSLLRQERTHNTGTKTSITAPSASKESNDGRGAKQHRFFQDLEARMSMPEQPSAFEVENNNNSNNEAGSSILLQGPPSGDSATMVASNHPLKSLMLFPRGIPLPWKQQQQTKDTAAPRVPFFARTTPSAAASHHDDPFSNAPVVSGAAMLSADELKELDAVVQQQKQQSRSWRVGPREAFIVFTLILAAFVYFMSKKNTAWVRSLLL